MSQGYKIPSKVLTVNVTNKVGVAKWTYDDGTGDPWWSGGSKPRDYQWRLNLTVIPQHHSSHLTRVPFMYNGMDIQVGDYIANNASGIAMKVVCVESKTDTSAVIIAEDVARYNTFRAPGNTGNGSFALGNATIFKLNEEGEPLIDPVPPDGLSAAFTLNLISRFQNFNDQYNFVLYKENHLFQPGDLIAIDPNSNEFVLADSTNKRVIGRVSFIGPSPNHFYINPIQKVVDNLDYLIGEVGDVIYADPSNPGGLRLEESDTEVFLKLREFSNSYVVGSVVDPSTTNGNIIEINDEEVIITGTGSLNDIVNSINSVSSTTGVVASTQSVFTEVITDPLELHYGEPALYTTPPAQASINGEIVTFDISTKGQETYSLSLALEEDMAEAINRDTSENIVASITTSNRLKIVNKLGGPIIISNLSPDVNGTHFGGSSSGSGISLSTSASTGNYLRLDANDARAILLRDIQGQTIKDCGLYSAENGQKAAALYIERGVRIATSTVVSNIPARDALSPIIGDQAYVLDSGSGHWALYLWTGSSWEIIASEASARADADSYEIELEFDSESEIEIGSISDNSRITLITITVVDPFDGSAALSIGDDLNNSRLMPSSIIDLASTGTYVNQSEYFYTSASTIKAYFFSGGASIGRARIVVSYQ